VRLAQSVRSVLPDQLALLGLLALPAVLLARKAQQVLQVRLDQLARLDHKAPKAQLVPRVPQVRLDHRAGLLDRQGLQAQRDLLDRVEVEAVVVGLRIPVLVTSLLFLAQLRLIL
jgi:hypothetical protein